MNHAWINSTVYLLLTYVGSFGERDECCKGPLGLIGRKGGKNTLGSISVVNSVYFEGHRPYV